MRPFAACFDAEIAFNQKAVIKNPSFKIALGEAILWHAKHGGSSQCLPGLPYGLRKRQRGNGARSGARVYELGGATRATQVVSG